MWLIGDDSIDNDKRPDVPVFIGEVGKQLPDISRADLSDEAESDLYQNQGIPVDVLEKVRLSKTEKHDPVPGHKFPLSKFDNRMCNENKSNKGPRLD